MGATPLDSPQGACLADDAPAQRSHFALVVEGQKPEREGRAAQQVFCRRPGVVVVRPSRVLETHHSPTPSTAAV